MFSFGFLSGAFHSYHIKTTARANINDFYCKQIDVLIDADSIPVALAK
jgi:hypothetical protein